MRYPTKDELHKALSLRKEEKNNTPIINSTEERTRIRKVGKPKKEISLKLQKTVNTLLLESDYIKLYDLYLKTRKSPSITFQSFIREDIILPFININ